METEKPQFPCEICGERATHFCECEICQDDGGRWVCDDCSLNSDLKLLGG